VPGASCLWKWYWRHMAWDEVMWLMSEALPQCDRKFRGLWSRAKLLAGRSAASTDPLLMYMTRSFEHNKERTACTRAAGPSGGTSAVECLKPEAGGDVSRFFAQGLATWRQLDCNTQYPCDGGWDHKPYIVTMAQLAIVAEGMAAAVDSERQRTGGDLGWGYRRLSAEKVKQALSVVVSGTSSVCADAPSGLEPLIIGRLCGHGFAGGIVLTDATGRVPVIFDGTSELEACHAEQLWLVGSFSLVVEYASSSATPLTWYYALDFPSATCLFQRQAGLTDARAQSSCSVPSFGDRAAGTTNYSSHTTADAINGASSDPATAYAQDTSRSRLWALVLYKSTLSSTPQQRQPMCSTPACSGPVGTGEPFFYADVEILEGSSQSDGTH
jgi:hypothetical protein